MPSKERPLHFVFQIGNRTKTMDFYLNILNMKVLRHEEFEQGCDAACNGPYDGKWSKTMIGYGDEDNNFVVELTYNYGIRCYEMGNDFDYLKIKSNEVIDNIKSKNWPFKLSPEGFYEINDPSGYKFVICEGDDNKLVETSLFVSDLEKSKNYWVEILKGYLKESREDSIFVSFDEIEFTLRLRLSKEGKINHAKAFGRIAFACPTEDLKPLQSKIDERKLTILTRFIELATPGKANVCVVILADPDGHEICFVGDEGFRELSKFDPLARGLIDQAIANDKSDEWHEKKNKKANN